jgi:predicted NAD/FAD-dependent oxidoreductase
MRLLVVGAGLAGLVSALEVQSAGHEVTVPDQPGDQQFGVLERIATGVIPKLVTEKPAPTSRPGVTVDTSHWRKPEDHLPD